MESRVKHIICRSLFFISSIVLVSCSGEENSIYKNNYPLATETYTSPITGLNINLPRGWFAADENKNNLIDIWLIKDDYSATISFIPLNFNETTESDFDDVSLADAVKLNYQFKTAEQGINKSVPEDFEFFSINDYDFAAYKYSSEGSAVKRVVLFKYIKQYYEVTAVPLSFNLRANPGQLFEIQNSVLSSIK